MFAKIHVSNFEFHRFVACYFVEKSFNANRQSTVELIKCIWVIPVESSTVKIRWLWCSMQDFAVLCIFLVFGLLKYGQNPFSVSFQPAKLSTWNISMMSNCSKSEILIGITPIAKNVRIHNLCGVSSVFDFGLNLIALQILYKMFIKNVLLSVRFFLHFFGT